MRTDAEHKFQLLVKDMVENTDFEEDLDSLIKEKGLDQIPEFDFLKENEASAKKKIMRRNPRFLKVAGFIIFVLVVSSAMTIAVNSEFAAAGKFKLDNLILASRTASCHRIFVSMGPPQAVSCSLKMKHKLPSARII